MPKASIALLLFLLFSCPAMATGPADEAGIRAVVEEFRGAIIAKQRERFLGLFLHGEVTWQSVNSDARLALARQQDPSARKAEFAADQTPANFIDGIVKDPKANEETVANLQVDSDGDAASVAFDFSYVRDGRTLNVGREYWLLVRTDAGWKIAAVTWSRNAPASLGTAN